MRTKKKNVIHIAVLSLVLMLSLTGCSAGGGTGADSASNVSNSVTGNVGRSSDNAAVADEPQTAGEDENLVILISEISETATFYPVTVNGTAMEVFAVKAPDDTIRTAFNTCQICNGSPLAYFVQTGDNVQCQNCGNRFPMNRVGIESGGCNPVPIFQSERSETDEAITISYDLLQANAYRFPENWKK